MKKKSLRWVILLGVLLIVLLVIAGGWWYVSAQYQVEEGKAPSSIFVYILTPTNGEEASVGDYVSLTLHAFAPEQLLYSEFFVDGESLGVVTNAPENATWTWQPLTPGLHVISAKTTTVEGHVGDSQGVLVNILAGDGEFQIPAEGGQTLEEIGAGYGIDPLFMAVSNPPFTTSEPLTEGQPVTIPIGAVPGEGNPIPPLAEVGSEVFSSAVFITWEFVPIEPVEKSYCYTTSGGGNWEKMPKDPFEFFQGEATPYVQVLDPKVTSIIQMECWGWLGGILKYLGDGKASFNPYSSPGEVVISGEGFIFTGTPQIPMDTGGVIKTLPPPFALREPESAADCSAHGHPLLAPFICNTLMGASVKAYVILEWEWEPKFCWPGDCPWMNDIDGYRIYQIDPVTKSENLLKEISNASNKIVAVPLPWVTTCYGVRAYSNDPAYESSDISRYCPGKPPATKQIILTPTDWLTAGGEWMEAGDCSDLGNMHKYLITHEETGFGNLPGEVVVGTYFVDNEGCYREGDFSAAVKFTLATKLPMDAVIQKAVLKFSKSFIDYGATGVASPTPVTCVASVGKSKQAWNSLINDDHYITTSFFSSLGYHSPIQTLATTMAPAVDVTNFIKSWLAHPEQNYGFTLTPSAAPHPLDDGYGECISGLSGFQLVINYYAP